MKTLERDRRTRRAASPEVESLDERIVPSTLHVAAPAGAEALVAVSGAQRQENHRALLETRQATHAISLNQRLERRAAILELRHEQAVARHDLRVARREARYLAHHPSSIIPPTDPGSSGILPANVSNQFQSLYTQYEAFESAGGTGTFSPTGVSLLVINGTNVGIMVKGNNTGAFSTLITELQSDGMQILGSSATFGIVEGMLPIAQLPTVAELPQVLSIAPMFRPMPL